MRWQVWLMMALSSAALAEDPITDQSLGTEADGYITVHPAAVTFTEKVSPSFPRKAHKAGYSHEECLAQLYVDEAGKTEAVEVLESCPEVFHKSVEKAGKKWRIEPVLDESGAAVPVTFVLRFRFEAG